MFRNITAVILIGIAGAVFFMFINPTYNEILNINKQTASYDEALSNSKVLEAERDKLTKKFNSLYGIVARSLIITK